MFLMIKRTFLTFATASLLAIPFNELQAASLTLTSAGQKDGFTLSTFATLNPGSFGYGPFGVAVASSGNVLVSNYPNDTRYVFQDKDGQTAASALATVSPSGSATTAYATAGGHAYGGVNGQFVAFNNDGTVGRVLSGVTPSTDLGMAGNPVNGHILASSSAGLIDINPNANGGRGSFTVVAPGGDGDGVSVSPDGKIVYSEQGSINGYNISTGALVYQSGGLFNSPDGTGVISSKNNLNGQIIVNNNNGEIDLLDPASNAVTVLATGGTRGDYASPDPTTGTLFLDYSDVVERLSCGPNCGIGTNPNPPGIPEPSTFGLFALPLVALAGAAIRRGRKAR